MKRFIITLFCIALTFFSVQSVLHAFEGTALDGNSYDVYMFCMNEAGDFCDQYSLKSEEFTSVSRVGGSFPNSS